MDQQATKPVWRIAIEEMLKEGDEWLSRSHFGRLAIHTRLPAMHPLDRHQAVLNALEKSGRFTKSYVRLDWRSRLFTPTAEALAEVQKSSSPDVQPLTSLPATL